MPKSLFSESWCICFSAMFANYFRFVSQHFDSQKRLRVLFLSRKGNTQAFKFDPTLSNNELHKFREVHRVLESYFDEAVLSDVIQIFLLSSLNNLKSQKKQISAMCHWVYIWPVYNCTVYKALFKKRVYSGKIYEVGMSQNSQASILTPVSFYCYSVNRHCVFMTSSRIAFKPKLNFMFQIIVS